MRANYAGVEIRRGVDRGGRTQPNIPSVLLANGENRRALVESFERKTPPAEGRVPTVSGPAALDVPRA